MDTSQMSICRVLKGLCHMLCQVWKVRLKKGSDALVQNVIMEKIENGGEDVDDLEVFARTHRHEKGKGKYANKKAEKLVDEFNNCAKESGNTQVDKKQVWVQLTRGRKRGRYYGLPGIIDKDHAHRSSTPVLTNGTQPMYTQQQVQDIVSQAVTSAVGEVREELGTRIQSLERIVDKPNTESHSHVLEEPPSSAVLSFKHLQWMDSIHMKTNDHNLKDLRRMMIFGISRMCYQSGAS